MQQDWNLMYQAVLEIESGLWQHSFFVVKSYNNISISAALILTPFRAKRYLVADGAREFTFNLQLSMDL